MEALHTKWRPKIFSEVIGQENSIRILQNQIKEGTVRQGYLFCGSAGCGKTTVARIMANALKADLVEIDAASNNGVDNVRELRENVKFKPLGHEKRVYIIDECFHGDSPISTPQGKKAISEIVPGEEVYNLLGIAKVSQVFKTKVPLEHLCLLRTTSGEEILTTKQHLFFTDFGLVEAQRLMTGEVLYDRKILHDLRGEVLDGTEQENLFECLSLQTDGDYLEKPSAEFSEKAAPKNLFSDLSILWKGIFSFIPRNKNLFPPLFEPIAIEAAGGLGADFARKAECEKVFASNVRGKPDEQVREHTKNDKNEDTEGHLTFRPERAWGERENNPTTTAFVSSFGGGLEIRVSCSHKDAEGKRLPDLLQVRPCLSRETICSRGGWDWAPVERAVSSRRQKGGVFGAARVESVAFYEPGSGAAAFRDYVGDREITSGIIELYDLEISGHPSYFVSDLLVHNCHMLSAGAFNALLKVLEEPPSHVIFILCTTDPQKLPATIISRLQRFDFRRVSTEKIVQRLRFILNCEGEEIDPVANSATEVLSADDDALEYIAKCSGGGVRDSISLLDTCLGYSGNVTLAQVLEVTGTVGAEKNIQLWRALTEADSELAIEVISSLFESGKDLKVFVRKFLDFVSDLQVYSLTKNWELIDLPSSYAEQLNSLKLSSADFQRIVPGLFDLHRLIQYDAKPKGLIIGQLLSMIGGKGK